VQNVNCQKQLQLPTAAAAAAHLRGLNSQPLATVIQPLQPTNLQHSSSENASLLQYMHGALPAHVMQVLSATLSAFNTLFAWDPRKRSQPCTSPEHRSSSAARRTHRTHLDDAWDVILIVADAVQCKRCIVLQVDVLALKQVQQQRQPTTLQTGATAHSNQQQNP
jgi:hypothetical protein